MSQPSRNKRNLLEHDPRRVVLALLALALIFAGSVFRQAYAQQKNTRGAKPEQKDEYHRPEPSHTITPQIPGTSRNKPDKVFLENADSMVKTAGEVDRQVVIGNVKFRQMGMWMYCDSAYYFPELNSMDAFGNVRMEQGDTLFVYSDKLFYDGTARFARLRCGPTEPSVRLINRNVKLTTDSLDYDLAQEMGWYAHGGRLEDEANVLTSIYGQYSPATKDAEFFHDVELHGTQNDFNLYTDTLYYNTDTHIARIETPTKILTSEDEILTSNGYYNTLSGIAELLTRSTVVHTDSLNRATFLEGDSIVYDPTTRISRAYSFRNPAKHPSPVVITDTARKATLIGGFAIYNDSTREAMATEYPLMMEYSRADTLFLRADTIRTWVLDRPKPGAIADSTAIAESLADKIEEGLMEENPLEENQEQENPMEETPIVETQIGESPIEESPIEETPIERETLIEETPIEEPQIEEVLIDEPLIEEVAVVDTSGEPAKAAEPQDSTWHMAKAYPRARFFRTDMQGVADTIVYTEIDSILKLIRKPIAWNEERQVRGDTIIVHLQDSTADWARILPGDAHGARGGGLLQSTPFRQDDDVLRKRRSASSRRRGIGAGYHPADGGGLNLQSACGCRKLLHDDRHERGKQARPIEDVA